MYMLQFYSGYGQAGWGDVGPVVRAFQDCGLFKRSRFFRPCWGHYVVFLGRILDLLLQCLTLYPGVQMGTFIFDARGNAVCKGKLKLVYASA